MKSLKAKLATQTYALTKLMASTWGLSLLRTRTLYTQVIRAVMEYGASILHTPSDGKA